MIVAITGGAGLVGSECCRLFAQEGYDVISVDNYMRGNIFGDGGDTRPVMASLTKEFRNITHIETDIRDRRSMMRVIKDASVIIHAAAQPSHPKSIQIPLEDFSINAYGTLQLLELVRRHNPDAVFIYCSTNKVYGDYPNTLPIVEYETRYDFRDIDGIDEACPIDQSMHTPFGVSKIAADLYTQEYARLYGIKTGIFRMGCITGGAAQAVEMHNWEPYFVKKNLMGERLNIYGFNGKQVRDVIHARDLARLFRLFADDPRPGEVYNIGGGRKNSTSLLEAIRMIEDITGKRMEYECGPVREGDHQVYITDLRKVKTHYNWDTTMSVREIFDEIYESVSVQLGVYWGRS